MYFKKRTLIQLMLTKPSLHTSTQNVSIRHSQLQILGKWTRKLWKHEQMTA